MQAYRWLVANLLFESGSVGIGHIYVALLHRLESLFGFCSQCLLNLAYKVHELHWLRTSYVVDSEPHSVITFLSTWCVVETLHRAVSYIVDEREVANKIA